MTIELKTLRKAYPGDRLKRCSGFAVSAALVLCFLWPSTAQAWPWTGIGHAIEDAAAAERMAARMERLERAVVIAGGTAAIAERTEDLSKAVVVIANDGADTLLLRLDSFALQAQQLEQLHP